MFVQNVVESKQRRAGTLLYNHGELLFCSCYLPIETPETRKVSSQAPKKVDIEILI